MHVVQLYNNYASGGGGETRVVEETQRLLRLEGVGVTTICEESKMITTPVQKASAFVNGIYSLPAKYRIHEILSKVKPDVVHVHNLYPLFSPSVLHACRDLKIPVVMTVHNHGQSCPTGAHFRKGKPCESCTGGREYNCVLHNCKGNLVQSTGYSLRSMVAQTFGLFRNNVDAFIAISSCVKDQLIKAGITSAQIVEIPHGVALQSESANTGPRNFVGYAGGLNEEKGIDTLISSAKLLPHINFKVAGTGPNLLNIAKCSSSNVEMVGWLRPAEVANFYRGARFTVVPSLWWEPFGLVVIEAMSYGCPVIAARSGALKELVEEGTTGFLYSPGDIQELSHYVSKLWADRLLCERMGHLAQQKIISQFSESKYVHRLIDLYAKVINGKLP